MKRCLLSLLGILAMTIGSFAQIVQGSVSGKITDEQQKALPGTTVLLLHAKDSSVAKVGVSDDQGHYVLEPVAEGSYLVKGSMIGLQPAFSAPVAVTPAEAHPSVPDLVLPEKATTTLKEVSVRAQKPLIEARADKIVLNVENSIANTGSSALEVLQRAPGVNVDNNDVISMKGRQGVNVMIDGKLVPMQGADLANLLKGMPANSIEKIELISNPGARYDAAGTAGIINIKTKKDKRAGANGTVSLGYGQGVYPKANGGLMLNYRNKKWTTYFNYNHYNNRGFGKLELDRRFYNNDTFTNALVQDNYTKVHYASNTVSGGADYSLSSKTTVGLMANFTSNSMTRDGNNHSDRINYQGLRDSYFNTQSDQSNGWYSYGANLNLRHNFDSSGRELSMDLDYAHYDNDNKQDLISRYYDLNGTEMSPYFRLYGKLDGYTEIRSFKADYVHPLRNNLRLEAGVKTSFVTADNNPVFYDRSYGGNVYDSTRSNHFIYNENINAAYVNASREFEKWGLQLGLRLENTRAEGEQKVANQNFDRNYTQLFPSIAVTRHLTPVHDLGLTLSRRIDRPNYQQLNPFKNYMDPTSVHQGNPFLNPSFTYNAELSHTYKNRFITTLGYSRTTDAITQVILPESGQLTVVTEKNLATNTIYTLSGAYPLQLTKWWHSMNSFNFFYNHYEGNLANTQLSAGQPALQLSTNNSFTLPDDWSAELSGWYQSRQRYGYMKLDDMYGVNLGIQKNLWNKKVTIKLAATDIFWRTNPTGRNEFNGYDERFKVLRDTRQVNVNFTYRFGKKQGGPQRRRATGADEERRRASGGSGGA